MSDKIKLDNSIMRRALYSLTKVSANQNIKDILLKSVTFLNLIKKSINSAIPLTSWKFGTCITKTKFAGETYFFFLPKGYDFNIYLNPYFHEYEITQFVSRILSKGDTFLDVGAHGGLYTIIASKKVGEKGKVISFEPNPLNLSFLGQNIKLNRLSNVSIISKAVSQKSGKMTLYYFSRETALTSARSNTNEQKIQVEVTSIDDMTDKLEIIKIIKIDTEGNDLNVLKGASRTLHKACHIIVEKNTSDVRQFLSKEFVLTNLKPSGYLLATNKFLKCDNTAER